MDEQTKRFLKMKFRSHFEQNPVRMPPSYLQREWAFIRFDPLPEVIMTRHRAFASSEDVRRYMTAAAPMHSYYSAAYYDSPSARRMIDKEWLGADLIFDLDADHLPGAKHTYSDMLAHVKNETIKLLDFLTDDFGIAESSIELVFSGGRGYHFHIYDEKIRELDSAQRREIVNYISGRGINAKYFLKKEAMVGDTGAGTKEFNGKKHVPVKYGIRDVQSGWGKRIAVYMTDYLRTEAAKDDKEMFSDLKINMNAGPASIRKLKEIGQSEEALSDIENKGRLEFFRMFEFSDFFSYVVDRTVSRLGVDFGASVDEPVTGDIHRLIRLPGSLHGGSGFEVKTIPVSHLPDFDPLTEAVAFSDRPTAITVSRPFSFEIGGNEYDVTEGPAELPEYAAVYLMCRGVANYGTR